MRSAIARTTVVICAGIAGCGDSGGGGHKVRTTATPVVNLGDATSAADDEAAEELLSGGGQVSPAKSGGLSPGIPRCKDDQLQIDSSTRARAEKSTRCIVNKVRKRARKVQLKQNQQLYNAANKHAKDMVSSSYFSHTGKSGSTMTSRVQSSGFMKGAKTWSIGENLAWGTGASSTPNAIVGAWMASPGHKSNILNKSFNQDGLAVAVGSPTGAADSAGTWVQEFGKKG